VTYVEDVLAADGLGGPVAAYVHAKGDRGATVATVVLVPGYGPLWRAELRRSIAGTKNVVVVRELLRRLPDDREVQGWSKGTNVVVARVADVLREVSAFEASKRADRKPVTITLALSNVVL